MVSTPHRSAAPGAGRPTKSVPGRAPARVNPSGGPATTLPFLRRFDLARTRQGLTIALVGMLVFSGYGTLLPASVRCTLPGAVGCPGGILGAAPLTGNSTLEMFFNVTMYDYGFWIINTVDGTNESKSWSVYEGWTVHINATSLKADAAVGGSAYHGIGIELNATGKQLLSLSAPVGKWVSASFVAPSSPYYHQHVWCTIECGNGHGQMYVYNFNVISAAFIPTVKAHANQTSGVAPLAVAFTATIQGGTPPYTTTWNFGDGSPSSSVQNTSHTYTLAGTYSASIALSDSKGYQASSSVTITVTAAAPLAATVAATPASGYAPFETALASTVQGGVAPYTLAWSLGDGSTASGSSVTHLFSAPGVFAVVLTVTDAVGSTTTAQASVTVLASTGTLGVAVAASPASGTAPLSVSLSATPIGGTAPYVTSWAFGDGTLGSGAAVVHSYGVAGAYEVTAFVTDAQGRAGANFTAVQVTGGTSAPLAAHVTETPSSGAPPLAIRASVSAVGGSGSYSSLTWAFGDGTAGSGPVVTHTYSNLGTYQLTATVRDSSGASAIDTVTVRVAGVVVNISVNRSSGDAPFSVSADASILGGTGAYQPVQWSWGDGSTSTGTPANHTYGANVTGAVVLRALVTDSANQAANSSQTLTIAPAPVASLADALPSSTAPPVSVNFTLTVAGGTGPYSTTPLWSFGDGTSTRAAGPLNHTFARAGHFLVSVQTNDSVGGVATASLWVNLSAGGLAGGVGLGGGGAGSWVFTGVDNPNQAALGLMGLIAISGLALLYHTERTRASKRAASARPTVPAPRPAAAAAGPRAGPPMATRPPTAAPPARPSGPRGPPGSARP